MIKKLTSITLAVFFAFGIAALAAIPATEAAAPTPPLEIGWGLSTSYTQNFNPFSTSKMVVTNEMYEPLFYFDQLKSKVTPMLGTSFAWSNHDTVLTATLRKHVKWSNGTPFTARDVVFTFDMLKKYPQMDTNGVWTKLASVTSSNPYTVTFHFKTADVPFDYYVLGQTPIVPKAIWSKLAGSPLKFLNSHPVISGPYLLNTFSTEEITLTPNARYWGGKPKVPELKVPIFTSNTTVVPALESGAIAYGGYFESNLRKLYVSAGPKYYHYWLAPNSPVTLIPNLTNPLLKQLVVRKAISEAINRERLNVLAASGYEPPANPTLLSYKNANQAGWIDKSLPSTDLHYQYNPKAAILLLTKAGFKRNRAGVFVSPAGKPLQFTLLAPSGETNLDAEDSLISSELKTVGIDVTVTLVTGTEMTADELSGHFQLAAEALPAGPTPYTMYNSTFGPNVSAGNHERWFNPKMEQLLRQFASTSNSSKEHAVMDQMERLIGANMPVIGISNTVYWYEYSNKYYVGWPTASNQYAAGSPYEYPAVALVLSHLRPR